MSFTLWRGVVGMVRPTRRPGTLEELIRILPEGIGIVPLLLNFKAGSKAEFLNSIPLYERFAAELAEQGMDVIMLSGAPPFMLLGPQKEAALTKAWTRKFKTPVITDPQMLVLGGLMTTSADLFFEPTRIETSRRLPKPLADVVTIATATLKDDAPAIGAARLAAVAVR